MLGKFSGRGGELSQRKSYFAYRHQDEGWYIFSAKPFAGAIEGTLTVNQIEFTFNDKYYSLFTGDPIAFARINIGVHHYASIQDADRTSSADRWQENEPRLAPGELANLAVEK